MQTNMHVLYNNPGWRVLRLLAIALLPLVYCVNAFAGKGDTQSALDKKISVEFKNLTLKEAVAKLGQCTPGVSYTYVESGIMNEGRVNFSAKDEKASEVLDKLLSPFSFSYTVMQYHVVIWYDTRKAVKGKASATIGKVLKIPRIACITGMVTNLKMDALPNVAIFVSGGAKAGTVNSAGRFNLYGMADTAILVFRAKGYKPQLVRANAAAQGFLLVQLATDDGVMQTAPLHK